MAKSRFQRRHDAARVLRKACRIARGWARRSDPGAAEIERNARRIRDNRTPCSCQMCRNPRRSRLFKAADRLTIQERKVVEVQRDQAEAL